jgi:hypothetical protein
MSFRDYLAIGSLHFSLTIHSECTPFNRRFIMGVEVFMHCPFRPFIRNLLGWRSPRLGPVVRGIGLEFTERGVLRTSENDDATLFSALIFTSVI